MGAFFMKDFSLRELSQQYAAGNLNSAQYREMRHALLDGMTAMKDEKVSFPDCHPVSMPGESDCRVSFSAKAFFLWFLAVISTLILLFIAWSLPDENENKNGGHPPTTSGYSSVDEKMTLMDEVTAENKDRPTPNTFRETPVLPNTRYRDVKKQKMSREDGGR